MAVFDVDVRLTVRVDSAPNISSVVDAITTVLGDFDNAMLPNGRILDTEAIGVKKL